MYAASATHSRGCRISACPSRAHGRYLHRSTASGTAWACDHPMGTTAGMPTNTHFNLLQVPPGIWVLKKKAKISCPGKSPVFPQILVLDSYFGFFCTAGVHLPSSPKHYNAFSIIKLKSLCKTLVLVCFSPMDNY